MLPMKFTAEEALLFSEHGCIEEWIHLFLKTYGRNPAFSEGLKLQKRYWLGPLLVPLHKLQRCCGPEADMQYYNAPEPWEKRVGGLFELLQGGWEYPPLIVQHVEGEWIVTDGNGRHEAMKRLQQEQCWAILWDSDGPPPWDASN